MFKNLTEKINSKVRELFIFDPSSFDDPVAMKTKWIPAKGGGTNVRTHFLIEVNSDRMEFRASRRAKLCYFFFIVAGMVVMIGVSFSELSRGNFSKDTTLAILLGLLFIGIGGSLLYFGTAPIVFDKMEGYFWKGRKVKHFASLKKVHALQIISEFMSGNRRGYLSYELNLILDNGKRINVVDHGNRIKLREDAAKLSDFLGKPIWDATVKKSQGPEGTARTL